MVSSVLKVIEALYRDEWVVDRKGEGLRFEDIENVVDTKLINAIRRREEG